MVFVLEVQKKILNSTVFYLSILMECLRCGKSAHVIMTKITKQHDFVSSEPVPLNNLQ